jgi:hypothetical protein
LAGGSSWGKIFLINTDVKAGLLELFFYINLSLLHKREKVAPHPRYFGERQSVFGDVDSLAGEMR